MNYQRNIKRVLISFILSILLVYQSGFFALQTVFAETITNAVTITAIDEDGGAVLETKAASFEEGETAFDVLEEVVEVEYEETEYGPFIKGINELTPEDGYYWGFFVNGSTSEKGAGDYELEHGDNLLFKVVDENTWPPASVSVTVSAKDLENNAIIPETTVNVVEQGTTYDALVKAAEEHGVNLEIVVDSQFLTYVEDLNDTLDNSAYWGMYLNDEYMSTGLVASKVHGGDHLELKAEKIEEPVVEEPVTDEPESEEPKDSNEANSEKDGSVNETAEEEESTQPNEETKNAPDQNSNEILESIDKVNGYLSSKNFLDWYGFITLHSLDKNVSSEIADNAMDSVVKNNGEYRNVTDVAKNILILTANGNDATNIEGYNLIDKLTNHERMTSQGNNGPIYSLLALNSGNYEVAEDAKWTKDELIKLILDAQLDNGGWSLSGPTPSVDIMGMALTALAPYQDREDVKKAIDKAVQYLSVEQDNEGGYPVYFNGGDSSESVAMVIVGLVSVGIDPTSEAFTKDGGNLVEHLLKFQKEDGGFSHIIDDTKSMTTSSTQALLGIAAYYKYLNNDGIVFHFINLNADEEETEEPDKEYKIEQAIERAANYILENGVDSEWEAIGLVQAGKEVPEDYIDILKQNIKDQVIDGLENGRIKITDIERLAIAAVAMDLDPRDVDGTNLIELIYNSPERRGGFDTMTFQGNNGLTFALIALDTQRFDVPEEAKWNRQKVINELLEAQNEDGSWPLNTLFNVPDIDVTGMVLIGLSPYKNQPEVREALDKAVEWLSSVQGEHGGFNAGDFVGGITSETTSQVIIGLTSYGIDPAGEMFTKNGHNLISHLLGYQNSDGGFKHTMDYDYSDSMGTEQALQALVAYDFFLNGKGNLYDFNEVDNGEETPGEDEENPENEETPGEDEENPGNEETPGEDEENPGNEETPGEDEENPKNEETPGEDEENPGNEVTPGEDEENPGNEETPEEDEVNPGSEETPGEDEDKPGNEETPGKDENPSSGDGNKDPVNGKDNQNKVETPTQKDLIVEKTTIHLEDIKELREGDSLVIQPKDAENQHDLHAEIDKKVIEKLLTNNSNLIIDKGDVSINIPAEILGQIMEEINNELLTISMVQYEVKNALGAVYDLTIKAGSKVIRNFNGKEITLSFKVNPSMVEDLDSNKVKVFYFNEETREWEVIENSVYNPKTGFVTANTTHLSIFGVFEFYEDNNEVTPIMKENTSGEIQEVDNNAEEGKELPKTATNLYNYMLIGSMMMVVGGLLLFIYKKCRTKEI